MRSTATGAAAPSYWRKQRRAAPDATQNLENKQQLQAAITTWQGHCDTVAPTGAENLLTLYFYSVTVKQRDSQKPQFLESSVLDGRTTEDFIILLPVNVTKDDINVVTNFKSYLVFDLKALNMFVDQTAVSTRQNIAWNLSKDKIIAFLIEHFPFGLIDSHITHCTNILLNTGGLTNKSVANRHSFSHPSLLPLKSSSVCNGAADYSPSAPQQFLNKWEQAWFYLIAQLVCRNGCQLAWTREHLDALRITCVYVS